MRKSVAFLLALVFLTASCIVSIKPAWASADLWTTKAPMHQARVGLGVAVVNGKIYAIGGYDGSYLGTNEEYDPVTGTWTFKNSMPTPRGSFGIAVYQNKIYCIGGANGSNSVTGVNEVYDPATDSWTTKASMPTATVYYASAVIDDQIYVIGGQSLSTLILDLNQVYDTKTDTWSLGVPVPGAVNTAAAGATTGVNAPKRIYVIGGYYPSGPANNTNQVYNPENDSWTFGASMPTFSLQLAIAVVNDKLYAIGGEGYNASNANPYYPLTDNEQYTPIGYGTIPEFPSFLILPSFMIATLITAASTKKKTFRISPKKRALTKN